MKKSRQQWWLTNGEEVDRIARGILRILKESEGYMGHTALKQAVLGKNWWYELEGGFDHFDLAVGLLLGMKRIQRSAASKGMKYRLKRPKKKG